MLFYVKNFRWIMLISGLLTCTMLMGLLFPETLLKSNFGETMEGPLAEIIVRNWAALIGLMGIILIYGALVPGLRQFALIIAGISKAIFITLVLSNGQGYMSEGIGIAVITDSIMIVLFILYLLFSGPTPHTTINS